MGNEVQTCCSNAEITNQPEIDKTHLFDFRYANPEEQIEHRAKIQKEENFILKTAEARPYSFHLRSIQGDPYADFDKYKGRGDSVYQPNQMKKVFSSPRKESDEYSNLNVNLEGESWGNSPEQDQHRPSFPTNTYNTPKQPTPEMMKKLSTVEEVIETEEHFSNERQAQFDDIMNGKAGAFRKKTEEKRQSPSFSMDFVGISPIRNVTDQQQQKQSEGQGANLVISKMVMEMNQPSAKVLEVLSLTQDESLSIFRSNIQRKHPTVLLLSDNSTLLPSKNSPKYPLNSSPQDIEGILVTPNGELHKGSFSNLKLSNRKNTILYPNGDYYDGELLNGQPQGKGEFIEYETMTRYVGEYQNGKKNGTGVEQYKNGSVYKGTFSQGKRSGQGLLEFPDGGFYRGSFQNGLEHGEGEVVLPGQEEYRGTFRNGMYHGKGELKSNNGFVYIGQFKDGLQDGFGMETSPNGEVYKGRFKNGRRFGSTNG